MKWLDMGQSHKEAQQILPYFAVEGLGLKRSDITIVCNSLCSTLSFVHRERSHFEVHLDVSFEKFLGYFLHVHWQPLD